MDYLAIDGSVEEKQETIRAINEHRSFHFVCLAKLVILISDHEL